MVEFRKFEPNERGPQNDNVLPIYSVVKRALNMGIKKKEEANVTNNTAKSKNVYLRCK